MSSDSDLWTPEITKKLNQIKERSWAYTWIHRENSIYLCDIYEWVSIIAYSLSFLNGVVLIFPNHLIYIRIFNIILSFGAGILMFYIKNKNLTETAERHKLFSSRFSSIYNNIDRQLSLPIYQRENALHYHRWITSQYDTLTGSAPDIDPPIVEEYVKKFAHKRKINPLEAAEYDQETPPSSKKKSRKKEDDKSGDTSSDHSSNSHSSSFFSDDDSQQENGNKYATIVINPNNTEEEEKSNNTQEEKESSSLDEEEIKEATEKPTPTTEKSTPTTTTETTTATETYKPRRGSLVDELTSSLVNIAKKESPTSSNEPFVLNIYENKRHRHNNNSKKSKNKLIAYELNRMDMNSNISPSTKSMIPEFEFEYERRRAEKMNRTDKN